MKKIILVVIVALLMGCNYGTPTSTTITKNNYSVSMLFENEGCKVYRFYDNLGYHYYTVCHNTATISTSSTESCGKNCSREVVINTTEIN